jgi:hypothetical protein
VTATSQLRRPGTAALSRRYASWRRGGPRLGLLACFALLAALPFATAPGHLIADTKFELAVNPAGFLSSAVTLWNPQQFGVLPNQAVGYLFPMGPFFELLRHIGTAGWIVQRLWLSRCCHGSSSRSPTASRGWPARRSAGELPWCAGREPSPGQQSPSHSAAA